MKKYNTPKKIATLCLVLSGILFIIGGAYAFYSYKGNSDGYVSITADNLTFRYKEGTNRIDLTGAMPLEDYDGLRQKNYFEFEIISNNPTDYIIPYVITARKLAGSDDIDDAIKIAIARVEYNTTDIYSEKFGGGLFEEEECKKVIAPDLANGDDTRCVKKYSAGDPSPDVYNMRYKLMEYDTQEACQNAIFYDDVTGLPESICVQENDKYVLYEADNYSVYNSLTECQESEDFNASAVCVKKYNTATLEHDVYTVEYYINGPYQSLEDCQEYAPNSPDLCAVHYPAGTFAEIFQPLKQANYNTLSQYTNESIDLSNYTEKKLYAAGVPQEEENYKMTYRIYVWVDYDADFTQEKYNEATFSLSFNVYSDIHINNGEIPTTPGLYDNQGNMVSSWDELEEMGFTKERIETNWVSEGGCSFNPLAANSKIQRVASCNPSSPLFDRSKNDLLVDIAVDKVLVLPNTITKIGDYALSFLHASTIVIPSSITSIGKHAFRDNTDILKSVIFLPNSNLVSIDDEAFAWCGQLSSLEVPASVTSIGENVFDYTPWYNNLSNYGAEAIYINGIEIPARDEYYQEFYSNSET